MRSWIIREIKQKGYSQVPQLTGPESVIGKTALI